MTVLGWRRHLHWLLALVCAGTLAWTIHLLWQAWPTLQANLLQMRSKWLAFVFAGNLLAAYLAFEAFRALFVHVLPGRYGRLRLAHLYFVGQLMKHLPGRIWGTAYQSASGNEASMAQWVGVNSVFMVLSTAVAIWIAAIVLGFFHAWLTGFAATAGGLLVYFVTWRKTALSPLLGLLRRLPMRAAGRLADALAGFADASSGFKLEVLGWLVLVWLCYLAAWAGYGLAWPGLRVTDAVVLCAIYTFSWFVGYISLISPSGMGVRELVFVLLARDFPPDAVAGLAVMGRMALLAVDVVLGVAFVPFRR
ncbi:MAG: hypothetical protein QM741_01690 [Rudaea sp.]|uniref:hypothetical protein n=1 Tax=Rudaea sp. TaxID=2136325 RepID=UPI0039E66EA9